ncbi:EipB family protein [Jiella avicenniae]|uniref:DUF1849 family protein n=1 Tax=Jiella avicenniae TaxID=2907202 RepID=A0A9X1NXC3_9HYPH|nr:DUF1849 family protein [Jiella avicenniae]MCE7027322.1 DUF1849 family protein [Jiella avicenniae]
MSQRGLPSHFLAAALVTGMGLAMPAGAAGAAEPVALSPHRASYEVALDQASEDLLSVDGRIAVALGEPGDCKGYGIDYRFVARFLKDQEIVVTDQQIRLTESRDGKDFAFDAESFVDSLPDMTTKGTAKTAGDATVVTYEEPVAREIRLPASTFPVHHTRHVVEAAKAGVPIFESHVFQGDADAEKTMTSTVVITPLGTEAIAGEIAGYGGAPSRKAEVSDGASGEDGTGAAGDAMAAGEPDGAPSRDEAAEPQNDAAAGDDAPPVAATPADADAAGKDPSASDPAAIAERLNGLKAWKITESFYNSDSDEDGLPVFETSYTLFENGVTGNQILKYDGYTLKARLSSLELETAPDCPAPAGE